MTNINVMNSIEFESFLKEHKYVILDFYSTECPPCEAFARMFEPASEKYSDKISFVKMLRQENREFAESMEVRGSPTVIFFKNGKEVGNRLFADIEQTDFLNAINSLLESD